MLFQAWIKVQLSVSCFPIVYYLFCKNSLLVTLMTESSCVTTTCSCTNCATCGASVVLWCTSCWHVPEGPDICLAFICTKWSGRPVTTQLKQPWQTQPSDETRTYACARTSHPDNAAQYIASTLPTKMPTFCYETLKSSWNQCQQLIKWYIIFCKRNGAIKNKKISYIWTSKSDLCDSHPLLAIQELVI